MVGRILVIDDASVVLRAMVRLLRRNGHDVFGVATAADGLEAVTRDRSIAVVVLDYSLEQMNGVQLAQLIWAIRPGLPLVLMSGWDPSQLEEVAGQPFSGFLHKPFLAEEVERVLADILQPSAIQDAAIKDAAIG